MVNRSISAVAAVAATLISTGALASPDWRDDRPRYSHGGQRGNDRMWELQRRQREAAYRNGYQNGQRNAYYNNGQRNAYYDNRNNGNYRRDTRWTGQGNYRWGPDGRIECRRNDGTTGLIVGALAGGTLGNVVAGHGDKLLGSIIGGSLGAILGKEVSKGNVRCR